MRSMVGFTRVMVAGFAVALGLEGVRLASGAAVVGGVGTGVLDLVYAGATLLSMPVWLAVVAGLAAWCWRAVANIRTFEPDFYETPGSAAIGWVIPGWNLYKPYDALSSIWSGVANHPVFTEPEPPGALLQVFWMSWVAAVVLGRVFGGGSGDALVGFGDVLAAGASIVSAIAGARLLWQLSAMQDRIAGDAATA